MQYDAQLKTKRTMYSITNKILTNIATLAIRVYGMEKMIPRYCFEKYFDIDS